MTTNSPRYMRAYYHRKRREVVSLLGGKCAICGCTDEDMLEIDHINGHNIKRSPSGSRGGMRNLWDAIKLIRAGRENELRILCKSCNSGYKTIGRRYDERTGGRYIPYNRLIGRSNGD